MKICLINNLFGEDSRGGAEQVVRLVAEELKRQGHEPFVVALRPWNTTRKDSGDIRALYLGYG